MVQRKRDGLVFLYCLLIAAVCLAICSKSSFLYPINDWTDANAYFSCGRGMLSGRVMYRDLYEHKGPLLYALHALCCLVSSGSFIGVYLLETLAVGLFLLAAYRILTLYGAKRSAMLLLPLIAAVMLSSYSFQQGDSAEELCMPMLAGSLYMLLKWLRQRAPARMSTAMLLFNGVLCGCVLWIKFTLLGLYIPWILGLMLVSAARREWKSALVTAGWFAAGVGLATVPWILYFGLNGAVGDWLKTYLYDNLFLYQDKEITGLAGRLRAMLSAGWNWFSQNPAYSVPLVLGGIWFTLRKTALRATGAVSDGQLRSATASDVEYTVAPSGKSATASSRLNDPTSENTAPTPFGTDASTVAMRGRATEGIFISAREKRFVWAMLICMALGVFIGGKGYVYYGLILAVFLPLAALPLCAPVDRRLPARRAITVALACATVTVALGLCIGVSGNVRDLLKPREQTMQYQFAAVVAQTPGATLLNYDFMDAGFYTACNITPSVKYFHRTNVHLQVMLDEQARYVADGVTDYVVTRSPLSAALSARYELVATAKPPADFWYHDVYLYRRKGMV